MYRKKLFVTKKLNNMQIFHGQIKYLNYPKNANKIMELGAGKLNDLINWSRSKIKNVYAIEKNHQSIEWGKKKYKKLKNKYKLPNVAFIKADINEDCDKIINEYLKEHKNSFDHIICHFAIHYFLNDKQSISNLFKLIDYFLKIGGTFKFTCVDGKIIYNLLKNKTSLIFKKNKIRYFQIKRKYKRKEPFKNYGQKINVYIISIGIPHDENLVNIKYIIKHLEKDDKYRLDYYKSFTEYFDKIQFNKKIIKLKSIEKKYSKLNAILSFTKLH